MKKIQGAITALVTPFKKNGELDVEALKKLVEWQIKSGIEGLVPCGSTGEAATLNPEEYQAVIRTVIETAARRVVVIAGATSNDTTKAIEYSRIAKKLGVDALLHATPYYNKPTLSGLLAHYKAIANAVDIPVVLYNVPGRTGLNLTASMTLELTKKIPQIIGIKEASGNLSQMMEILKSAPKYFSVLSGDDAFTYPLMAMGGDGIISVASNEIPKEMAQLARAALEGDWVHAKKLHFEWLDLMDINFIESNPQPVKTALFLMNRIKESFRLPLVPMQKENKEKLITVLKKYHLI